MASKHKQEDPWAGFVDVLSNILMVVIFLVVILGISIFAISQQVTKAAVEKALEQERKESQAKESEAKAKGAGPTQDEAKPAPSPPKEIAALEQTPPADAPKPKEEQAKPKDETPKPKDDGGKPKDEAGKGETQAADGQKPADAAGNQHKPVDKPAQKPVEKAEPPAQANPDTSAGDRSVETAERVKQQDEIAGNTGLSVRSEAVQTKKELEVASEEVKPSFGPIKAQNAEAFLKLTFTKGSFRIDEQTAASIKDYLASVQSEVNGSVEIRGFAQSTVGSISEAKRIAYYRAMQTRSELLKSGFKPEKISVVVRESSSPEELDVVQIYKKP